jgi:hypothetical protein
MKIGNTKSVGFVGIKYKCEYIIEEIGKFLETEIDRLVL